LTGGNGYIRIKIQPHFRAAIPSGCSEGDTLEHHPQIRTRVFDLAPLKYGGMSELARAMGLSLSQVYRVREGKRQINQKFIIGAMRAFPDLRMDQLFYVRHAAADRPPLIQSDPLLQYRYFSHLCRLVAETLCKCPHLQDDPGGRCQLRMDCLFFSRELQVRIGAIHNIL
jgi:hypothetical protein